MPESQAAYVDEHGRPRLRLSIVAFFDVLGFSHLATSTDAASDSQRLLDRIAGAIEDSRSFVRHSMGFEEGNLTRQWGIKFFSDNLAIGFPIEDNPSMAASTAWFIVRCAQRYQLRMATNGFFLRGGLTQGHICLTDEIIFGSALIECYQLESKASIVPRVLLSDPLERLLMALVRENPGDSPTDLSNGICRDIDGWWFVNYLQAACEPSGVNWDLVEAHKQGILSSLAGTTRHDVLPKFGWACRYHNVFCHWHRDDPGYRDQFRVERADEQSTIFRIKDVTSDP